MVHMLQQVHSTSTTYDRHIVSRTAEHDETAHFSRRTMPFGNNLRTDPQLYTKRRFLQVDSHQEKFVRLNRKGDHVGTTRHPQRLIRLVPVQTNGFKEDEHGHSRGSANPQVNEDLLQRISTALEDVASISDKFKGLVDKLKKENVITTREQTNIEKNIVEKTETNTTHNIQKDSTAASDAALNAVKESLALLLDGQQRISSRIDGLMKEQEASHSQLEDGLKKVIDELKAEIAGSSLEQSEELEKLKEKQSHLYKDFNLLNLRLNEMEDLVAKLMKQSEPPDIVIRVPERTKPATIEEIDSDEDSLHSTLTISSGSPAEGPTGPVKKTRKPSQAFLYSQSTEDPVKKENTEQEPIGVTHF